MTTRTPRRRNQILAAAARLIAAQGPSANTSVREIADEAGVLSGSLYYHFKAGKDEIIEAIISMHLEDLLARYARVTSRDSSPVEMLEGLIRASFDALAAQPDASQIYQNEYRHMSGSPTFAAVRDATHRIQTVWMGVIYKGVDEGVFRRDVEPIVFYRFARDAIWPSVRWYLHDSSPELATIANSCVRLFLDGLVVGRTEAEIPPAKAGLPTSESSPVSRTSLAG